MRGCGVPPPPPHYYSHVASAHGNPECFVIWSEGVSGEGGGEGRGEGRVSV